MNFDDQIDLYADPGYTPEHGARLFFSIHDDHEHEAIQRNIEQVLLF
jgi:hypothetical protein